MKEKITRAVGEVTYTLTEIFIGALTALMFEIVVGLKEKNIHNLIGWAIAFGVTVVAHIILTNIGNGEHELYDMHRIVIRVSVPTRDKYLRFIANIAGGVVGTFSVESFIAKSGFLYSVGTISIATGLIIVAEGCIVDSALIMILDKCCGKLFMGIGTIVLIIDNIRENKSLTVIAICYMIVVICCMLGALNEMYSCGRANERVCIAYTVINLVTAIACIVELIIASENVTTSSLIIIVTETMLLVDMIGKWDEYTKNDEINIDEQIVERFGSEKDLEEYRQIKKELTKPDEEEKNDSEGKGNK